MPAPAPRRRVKKRNLRGASSSRVVSTCSGSTRSRPSGRRHVASAPNTRTQRRWRPPAQRAVAWRSSRHCRPCRPTQSSKIIEEVTFIRSFADAGTVLDSNIGTADNWAKYRLSGSSGGVKESGTGRLSFFTLWRNPHGRTITVAAGARLVVNAHVGVDADWNGVAAWFISGSDARATVRARTTVWAVWDSSVSAIVNDRILADVGASGGFFGDDDSTTIEFNDFLSASGFLVPGHAYILIEVELMTEWSAANGAVALDAASGAFQVAVPHLILTLT